MPILAIVGIDEDSRCDMLAFTLGEREDQKAWEDVLDDLKSRGVGTIDLWITDGNKAILNAIQNKFTASQRQHCILYKMENVLGYIPENYHELVRPELKAIFYQTNREKADQEPTAFIARYESVYPTAIECLKRDLEACLTFYSFPDKHWKYIRTTNIFERLFVEVKKRSHKMAAAFHNQNSCLLMFYAVIRNLNLRRIFFPRKETATELLHNS